MMQDNQSRSELDPAFNEIKEALNPKRNKQGLLQEDYWWLPHIFIVCRKNGCEGTLPGITWESEFNSDRDSKKVLDAKAETTNKKDFMGPNIYKGRENLLKQAYISVWLNCWFDEAVFIKNCWKG